MSELLKSYTGHGTRVGAPATKGLETFTAMHAWVMLSVSGESVSYGRVCAACDQLKIRRTGKTKTFPGHFQIRPEDMPRLRAVLGLPLDGARSS